MKVIIKSGKCTLEWRGPLGLRRQSSPATHVHPEPVGKAHKWNFKYINTLSKLKRTRQIHRVKHSLSNKPINKNTENLNITICYFNLMEVLKILFYKIIHVYKLWSINN